jgi:hypothetical protein
MDKIELRKIGSLRLHPDNVAIFGHPQDEPNYEEIREDIRKRGLQEPLIILSNGTILSGHIRFISVCWAMEQDGLIKDQIDEQVIAVRVHEDFDSKEEELEYLMSANEKRRQLDPRRIATSLERLEQVIESSWVDKKGVKKSDALKGLADRLGTSHKLAKNYRIIFGSKIVPDEVKDRVNSKGLSPSAVLEAIKFAEETAKRESRAPSMADVDAYIKHPKAKVSLADTVRQMTKGTTVTTSTGSPSPTPKPESKPATVVVAPEPPKVSTPEPVAVVEPVKVSTVHTSHCCLEHGCKYDDPNCPVAKGEQKQEGPCETCGLVAEGYYDQGSLAEDQGVDLDEDPEVDDPNERPLNPVDWVISARNLLKEALRVIVLDPIGTSELLGLHTELTSYLLAMDIIKPSVESKLPTTTIGKLELCSSIVQGIGDDVQDPQATRDALLDLMNYTKTPLERLSTTKRGFETNGLYCPECFTKQYLTPSGVACEMGHGGLEGITNRLVEALRLSQATADENAKCAICGNMVETAKGASHASCPKCGLVDTGDVEPVVEKKPSTQPPPNDESLLSEEELAAILSPEPTKEPSKAEEATKKVLKDPPTSTDPTKKANEPKKTQPPVQPSILSASIEDESALVSAVIDDFMSEIQKAGGVATA